MNLRLRYELHIVAAKHATPTDTSLYFVVFIVEGCFDSVVKKVQVLAVFSLFPY
jgi:hypothetical protein